VSNIPESWIYTLLSEIALIQMGQSPNSRSYNVKGEGLPFFQGKADFGKLFPTVRKWCTEPERVAEAGDILLSVRAPVGPTNFAAERCCIGRGLAAIQAIPPFNQKYLLHYFRNIQPWLSQQGTGTTFAGIGSKVVQHLEIPVAPLSEQKQIADKLDSLFARLDACRDRLDRVSLILKRFRQSVVNAATSGELTKDWVYTDNPEIWQEALIGDLLVGKPRNGYSPRAVEFETGTRSLTLTATTSGRFNPTHIKYIDEKIPEDSYLWLEPDDILIQRANTLEYVGVSAIYDGSPKRYIYPDLMMRCRANNRVLTKFLYHLLSSDIVRSYFRKNATGTTGNMPKINQQTVISAPVWVPPMDEQQEIVRRVDVLFDHADRLENRYRRACTIFEQLTPALLDKAFRGDLMSQDPNDEPASVLLDHIRMMRVTAEATVTKPRQRKSTSDKPSKSEVAMLKRKDIQISHLSDILKVSSSMTAENLWSASQLEIDDFYEQLKDEEASGLLKETREESTNAPRLLEAV